jgi:phosphate-selective porin OprO and OprP
LRTRMPTSRRWLMVFSFVAAHACTGAAVQSAPRTTTSALALQPVPPDIPDPSSQAPPSSTSTAPSPAEPRLDELDKKLRRLEQRWDDEQKTPAPKPEEKKAPPRVALPYAKDGVGISSADGKLQLSLRPMLQMDGRFFAQGGTDTFLLRRVRPTIEGTAFEFFEWRIMPELAGTPNIQDAFINIRFLNEIQLRAGKFKSPVGLERLQSDPDLTFLERGLPTNLVPDRDIGVQLHGDVLGGLLVYAGGLFNGAGDGVQAEPDISDKKDLAGRVMVRPFQLTNLEPLRKLGLGIAATHGTHVGALPGYRTPGQLAFFQYAAGALASGTHRRLAPQAYFYYGPVGAFAEYVRSSQIVSSGAATSRVDHHAWQVVASVFLTGENASYTAVTPKGQLNPRNQTWGALELVARYGEMRLDNDAFALQFADITRSASKATDMGIGLNWHFARSFKFMINYERTNFQGGDSTGPRPAEIVVLSRLQAAY